MIEMRWVESNKHDGNALSIIQYQAEYDCDRIYKWLKLQYRYQHERLKTQDDIGKLQLTGGCVTIYEWSEWEDVKIVEAE